MSVATIPARPPLRSTSFQLGCGIYDAYVLRRGGSVPMTLTHTSLTWGRSLDNTSDATVQIDGVVSEPPGAQRVKLCAETLSKTRPWQNELGIYRDGVRVWRGPLTICEYPPFQANLSASDLSAWWQRRLIHYDHDYSGVDVDMAALFEELVLDAMNPDNSCGLIVDPPVAVGPCRRQYAAADYLMADTALRDLAQTGVDWTVVDSHVLLGGPTVPITPRGYGAADVPILLADHFAQPPTIRLDGSNQLTRVVVRGKDGTVVGASGGVSTEFGLLENVVSNELALDVPSAQRAADSILAESQLGPGSYATVVVVAGGTLAADAPVTIDELIPGARIDVRINHPAFPVVTQYRLGSIAVTASADLQEEVAVTFIPLGTSTSTEPQ